MALKRILLGTTALLAVGAMGVQAAEVKPLGALDISVGGFARWYAFIGDLDDKNQSRAGSYDFRTDTEVYFYVRGQDEATGLRYGANIELEADTNSTADSDEMFVFIAGNFGEFRFGDEDGAADNGKVGAYTIAAFSGGIDGVGPIDMGATVDGADSGDDTKIIYYTPVFSGIQAGVSFTPHVGNSGTSIGSTNSGGVDDMVEGLLSYKGSFGDVGLLASLIGSWGHFNSPAGDDEGGGDQTYKVYGGLSFTAFGFKFGGGWGYQQGAAPDCTSPSCPAAFVRGADYQWYNLGVGGSFGPANVSVNWGHAYNTDLDDSTDAQESEPQELVFGVDVGVAPGLVLGGELAWFDLDLGDDSADGSGDKGVLGLVGVRLAF